METQSINQSLQLVSRTGGTSCGYPSHLNLNPEGSSATQPLGAITAAWLSQYNVVVEMSEGKSLPMRWLSWNAHFYLLFTIFCILYNQVMTPSLHMMARKYSHVMVCHMSDCMVLVDQACNESCG